METYSIPAGTIYRTKSGNEAGKISSGTLVSFGDATITKGVLYHVVVWSNKAYLVGMYIDKSSGKIADQPEPTGTGATVVLTEKSGIKRYFDERL